MKFMFFNVLGDFNLMDPILPEIGLKVRFFIYLFFRYNESGCLINIALKIWLMLMCAK